MSVIATATVRMTVVTAMIENEYAHHVDAEAENGYEEEALVVYFRRLKHALDGLAQDEKGDEDEKDAVEEPGHNLGSNIARSANSET